MKFVLQQNVWQGFEPVEIDLPTTGTGVPRHSGGRHAGAHPEEIKARINAPYGSAPLRELAKGKERVAIVFDDISRATPTKVLAEIVLEELHAAGIRKEQIRFICALGTHGAHDRNDFVASWGRTSSGSTASLTITAMKTASASEKQSAASTYASTRSSCPAT
jgi:nickel-dependent lactate racemase